MNKKLHDSLETLRSLTPPLNKAVDLATAEVNAVERFLNEECGIGIDAEVHAADVPVQEWPSHIENTRGLYGVLSLVYRRIGGKFRIGVEHWISRDEAAIAAGMDPNAGTVWMKPWAECTRADKLRTFPVLSKLVESMLVEATNLTSEAEDALAVFGEGAPSSHSQGSVTVHKL